MKIQSYKDLIVWQKAMLLVELVYQLTETLPNKETFGLTSQTRRSGVSIPSNIAEGFGRNNLKEYIQFLYIAIGSCLELETQLLIIKKVYRLDIDKQTSLLDEIIRMLYAVVGKLKNKNKS